MSMVAGPPFIQRRMQERFALRVAGGGVGELAEPGAEGRAEADGTDAEEVSPGEVEGGGHGGAPVGIVNCLCKWGR